MPPKFSVPALIPMEKFSSQL